jgi:hypothetical protein
MKAVHLSSATPALAASAAVRPAPTGRMPADPPTCSLDSVGHRLRAAYASTLEEPIPVRLTDLLERLGERERSRSTG